MNNAIAVSQITTTPISLDDELVLAKRFGYGLELAEKKLPSDPEEADDVLWRIKESDVAVVSLQGQVLTPFPTVSMPEPSDPERRLEALMSSVERFAKYWPSLPLVTNTGALTESGDEAQVWERCVPLYKQLGQHAESAGMRIALEALAPSMQNRNSILFSFDQARELASEVNHPSFGVCLDTYNSWQDDNLAAAIRAAAGKLFLVQLADWRRPRSYHDRHALGEGVIPLASIIQKVTSIGYSGPFVLEIFSEGISDSLWENDARLEDAISTSVQYLREQLGTEGV
jgi:sugar phosphate isomerase/epimerase